MKTTVKLMVLALCITACASIPIEAPKAVAEFYQENPELIQRAGDYRLIIPRPFFPQKALADNQEGWCAVSFSITPKGNTLAQKILECSPVGYFETAALDVAGKIKVSNPPSATVENFGTVLSWKIAR